MIGIMNLKGLIDRLEQITCCDELNRTERDHLSWALAHLREAGKESEEGTGRSVVRLQDDLWEDARRFADKRLAQAWVVSGLTDQEKKGVAA